MSQESIPGWLAWITPILAACAGVWALARLLFVTRAELANILAQNETTRKAERLELHHENLGKFDELFERMGHIEKDVSFIRGQQSNR